MRYYLLLFISLLLSCQSSLDNKTLVSDFSERDKEIIVAAKELIATSAFVSLISVDKQGQPRARVMEFFQPDDTFIIWLGTNPRSRKVTQIKANPKVTLHFFNQSKMAYVSLMGKAEMVNDDKIKATKFKKGWEQFYKNKTDDFMLIKFTPETLEYIGILKGFTGDKETWAPHKVVLRE